MELFILVYHWAIMLQRSLAPPTLGIGNNTPSCQTLYTGRNLVVLRSCCNSVDECCTPMPKNATYHWSVSSWFSDAFGGRRPHAFHLKTQKRCEKWKLQLTEMAFAAFGGLLNNYQWFKYLIYTNYCPLIVILFTHSQ